MAETNELRGLRNIVTESLRDLDRPGHIPPVVNRDGSIINEVEAKEVGEAIRAAREAVDA